MSLSKQKGSMYNWCTHTHNPLGGACSHQCSYCFTRAMAKSRPVIADKYTGKVRLIEKELGINYGSGRTIFICSCTDLFASDVCDVYIKIILQHCRKYPKNTYVFQTKNPARYHEELLRPYWPEKRILGTTIESNRNYANISKAPFPVSRALAMGDIEGETFVTIEPILDFDVTDLVSILVMANPTFINIGADSKGSDLPEPSKEKIEELLMKLSYTDIEIRRKVNLERLLK
jgi:protein gp37